MKTLSIILVACLGTVFAYAQTESVEPDGVLSIISAEYTIEALPFNTDGAEFSPLAYRNGLLFCRNARGDYWSNTPQLSGNIDLYYTETNGNNRYQAPVKIKGGLNTAQHEGQATLSPNGRHIYFTQERIQSGRKSVWGIFDAELQYGQWSNAKVLYQGFKQHNLAHPTLSADGNKLYFAADLPSGQGGMDIYVCDRKGNFWGLPANLGAAVNSPADEVFPFMHPNGTLYFASDRKGSLGGLDIFVAIASNNRFEPAQALPSPINSPKDDFGITVANDGQSGYFSTTRKGNADIFAFTIASPAKFVSFYTDADAAIRPIPAAISAPKKQATNTANWINTQLFDPANPLLNHALSIEATPFELGSADLTPRTTAALDKVAAWLHSNQSLMIAIEGHTDARGDAATNLVLSTKRAKTAQNYLVLQGISPERIETHGRGETQIQNYCLEGINCPEEKHAENNRLDFYLTHGQLFATPVSANYAVQNAPIRGTGVFEYEVQVGPLKNIDTRTYYEYKQISPNLNLEDTPKGKVAIFGPYSTEQQAEKDRVKVNEHTSQKATAVIKKTLKTVESGGIKDEKPTYELFVGPYKHVSTDIYHQFTQLKQRTGVRYTPKGMMIVLGPFDSTLTAEQVAQQVPPSVLSRKTQRYIYTDSGRSLLKTIGNKKHKKESK